jgi:hypothetical protein
MAIRIPRAEASLQGVCASPDTADAHFPVPRYLSRPALASAAIGILNRWQALPPLLQQGLGTPEQSVVGLPHAKSHLQPTCSHRASNSRGVTLVHHPSDRIDVLRGHVGSNQKQNQ